MKRVGAVRTRMRRMRILPIIGVLVATYLLNNYYRNVSSGSSSNLLAAATREQQQEEEIRSSTKKHYNDLNDEIVIRNPRDTCITDPKEIPESWKTNSRVYSELIESDRYTKAWTIEEQALADSAARKGLDELIDFYYRIGYQRIKKLSTDGANSLMDQCFGSTPGSSFRSIACDATSRLVKIITEDYVVINDNDNKNTLTTKNNTTTAAATNNNNATTTTLTKYCYRCTEVKSKAKLLGYANYLAVNALPDDTDIKTIRDAMIPCLEHTLRECQRNVAPQQKADGVHESSITTTRAENFKKKQPKSLLNAILKIDDWEKELSTNDTQRLTIRHLVHRSNTLSGLYSIEGFDMSPVLQTELDEFTYRLWTYLGTYDAHYLTNNRHDSETVHHAYMVTHAAYMPSGYSRHMSSVGGDASSEWLYKYIRENFYDAIDLDDDELVSEFVDIIRHYGCSEDTDLMVKHGTRYLLQKFVKRRYKWIDDYYKNVVTHHEDGKYDYKLIHGPWTATPGVSRKQMEPIVPGSYGYGFRKALERGAKIAAAKKKDV